MESVYGRGSYKGAGCIWLGMRCSCGWLLFRLFPFELPCWENISGNACDQLGCGTIFTDHQWCSILCEMANVDFSGGLCTLAVFLQEQRVVWPCDGDFRRSPLGVVLPCYPLCSGAYCVSAVRFRADPGGSMERLVWNWPLEELDSSGGMRGRDDRNSCLRYHDPEMGSGEIACCISSGDRSGRKWISGVANTGCTGEFLLDRGGYMGHGEVRVSV